MEKEFIPYELALRMKELGFDEVCLAYYDGWNGESHLIITNESGSFLSRLFRLFRKEECDTYNQSYVEYLIGICTAPTFSQTFRWFRERDFHTTIESYHCLGNDKPFGLGIDQKVNGKWDYVDYSGDGNFDTYEEAQIKSIESILQIMEKKI